LDPRNNASPSQPAIASTSAVKGREIRIDVQSESPQIICRQLAGAAVLNKLEANLLTLLERAKAGALNCGDMHEYIWRAVIWLNEAETLAGVQPLNGSRSHNHFLSIAAWRTTIAASDAAGPILRGFS
jgi:hypothetical protein